MDKRVSMIYGDCVVTLGGAVDYYKYHQTDPYHREALEKVLEKFKIVDYPLREDHVPPFYRHALWTLLKTEPNPDEILDMMPYTHFQLLDTIDSGRTTLDKANKLLDYFKSFNNFDLESIEDIEFPEMLRDVYSRVEGFLDTFSLYQSHYSADGDIFYQAFPSISF